MLKVPVSDLKQISTIMPSLVGVAIAVVVVVATIVSMGREGNP